LVKPDFVLILDAHPVEDGRIQKHIRFLQEQGYAVYHLHFIPYTVDPGVDDGNYSLFGEKSWHINLNWKIRLKGLRLLNYLLLFSPVLIRKTNHVIRNLGVPIAANGIIHVHDPILLPLAKKIQGTLLTHSKIVYDRHEVYEDMKRFAGIGGYRQFEKISASSVSGVVVVSDGSKDSVAKIFPNAFVQSVPNFPMRSFINENKITEKIQNFSKSSSIHCVYIGSLQRNLDRDIELLLHVAEEILTKIPNSQFSVGGSCSDNELLTRFDTLQKTFPNRFNYLGIVPYSKVVEFTQNTHIGFFFIKPDTSYWVPCSPNKVFEYLSCGVIPVVRADCDYRDEMRLGGLFFERDSDEQVITDAIISLLKNSEEMKKKMELCLDVGSRFKYESVVNNYILLYNSILNYQIK
jgi:glycosyltransferase involved in cell wall biosynthesis